MPWLLAVTSAYVAVAALRTRSVERVGKSLLVPPLAVLGLLARGASDGTSADGSLRGAAVVLVLVLLSTRGEPDLVFDVPLMKGRDFRRLPKGERKELQRRQERSGRSQLLFIGLVLAFVVATAVSESLSRPFS